MPYSLTPIESLLIELCRLEFSDEEKRRIGELMNQVTDWAEFVSRSNEQGIIALSWYNINETGNKNLIPAEYYDQLHSGYLKSLVRNTAIYKLIDEVLDIAHKENIKVVLLKGLTLEKTVYGNKGLRQMNDLDILVRKEDAIRLRKLMLKKGFESAPVISPLHEKILPYYGKHLPEMYKRGFSVEIHFRLFDEKGEDLTVEIIDTAVPDEQGYLIPEPTLHFIYLVKHLVSHEIKEHSQLRLYADLVNMLVQNGDEILQAGDLPPFLKEKLNEKLFILNKTFGVDLPSGFSLPVIENSDEIKSSFYNFLHLETQNPKPKTQNPKPDTLLKPLFDFDKTWDKLLFITGYLFPSVEFMMYRYKVRNRLLVFLWYPVRWMKLFKGV